MANPDLVVVTSYPPQGQVHGKGTVGVASYAKNTLLAISRQKPNIQITILAEILPNQPLEYRENNIHVVRCWQRNSFLAFFQILKKISQIPTTNTLIEFEMAMLGSPLLNVFFPLFLLILKVSGKITTVVLHQVVLNFSEISGHIGQKKDSPLNPILSFFAAVFYKLVIKIADRIIVFEQFLKDRLDPDNSKIVIIPHGVEPKKLYLKPEKSSSFTITTFGFLAWYKGTDWIAKTFSDYLDKHPKSRLRLVIAGGPNPNHLDKEYYQEYLKKITVSADKHPTSIVQTGFVNENDIIKYYSESDLIILPYRVGMSSSGPLSLAFTYHKPFMVSAPIAPILKTKDIADSFKLFHLKTNQVTFSLNSKNFFHRLLALKNSPVKLDHLSLLSQKISQSRAWSQIGKMYLKTLIID
ncbi:MAG: glycosyltransferase [Candidatus Shapirobacteria bacterium]|jgi:glycosyltransferase involved in cell wall biosynthesis